MDGGSVDIHVNVRQDGVTREMRKAREEIRQTEASIKSLQGQVANYEQLVRRGTPGNVLARWFPPLSEMRAQQAGLSAYRTELQGVIQAERQATQAAQQRARTLGGMIGRSGLRTAGIAGGVAAAGYIIGQNLEELGEEGSPQHRLGGAITSLYHLNPVAAFKSVREQVRLTDDQIKQLANDSRRSSAEIDKLAGSLTKMGYVDAAKSIRELRQEMDYQRQNIIGDLQGGRQATFGITPLDLTAPPKVKQGTLNLYRRQRTALAATTAGNADDIAETRKNIAYLERLKKDVTIVEKARTNLYTELKQQQDALAALTAKPPAKELPLLPPALEMQLAKARTTLNRTDDNLRVLKKIDDYLTRAIAATKDINRKTGLLNKQADIRAEIQSVGQGTVTSVAVNAASVVGALGQGPFMQGPVMSFAQGFGYKPKAADYLRDIRAQVAAGTRLDRQLGMLRRRGLGGAAVAELAGQGLGASELVNALAKAPVSLVRQYGRAAERREEVAARMQTMTAEIQTANIVIRNGRVTGIDRNGDGRLTGAERFTSGPVDR